MEDRDGGLWNRIDHEGSMDSGGLLVRSFQRKLKEREMPSSGGELRCLCVEGRKMAAPRSLPFGSIRSARWILDIMASSFSQTMQQGGEGKPEDKKESEKRPGQFWRGAALNCDKEKSSGRPGSKHPGLTLIQRHPGARLGSGRCKNWGVRVGPGLLWPLARDPGVKNGESSRNKNRMGEKIKKGGKHGEFLGDLAPQRGGCRKKKGQGANAKDFVDTKGSRNTISRYKAGGNGNMPLGKRESTLIELRELRWWKGGGKAKAVSCVKGWRKKTD